MSTHNIRFHGELAKIIPELSSNTLPYPLKYRYILVEKSALSRAIYAVLFCLTEGKGNPSYILVEKVLFQELYIQ